MPSATSVPGRRRASPRRVALAAWGAGAALLTVLSACGADRIPDPPGGPTLRNRMGSPCPDLSGTYAIAYDAIFDFTVKARLDRSWRGAPFDSVVIAPSAPSRFRMLVWARAESLAVPFVAGEHFDCVEGWAVLRVQLYNQDLPSELIDPVKDDDRADRFTLALAASTDGRLHGRIEHESWQSFGIWSGDGASNGRLPWTTRRAYHFYRWEPPGGYTPEPASDSLQTEKLLDEEYLLEHGTPRPRRR